MYADSIALWSNRSVFEPELMPDLVSRDAICKLASMYDSPKDLIESACLQQAAPLLQWRNGPSFAGAEIHDPAWSEKLTQWRLTRDDVAHCWVYHCYDSENHRYQRLHPGDTIPPVRCLPIFNGVQHLRMDSMPEVVVCRADRRFRDSLGISVREKELFGNLYLIIVNDGIGTYFDLTGYVHVGSCPAHPQDPFFSLDIFVKVPPRAKSARSAQ